MSDKLTEQKIDEMIKQLSKSLKINGSIQKRRDR